MSDVLVQWARVRAAFDKPTLHLLSRPDADLVLTVLAASFGGEQDVIAAQDLHVIVDGVLAELAAHHQGEPQDKDGRAFCRDWVERKWLVVSITDDQREEYSLTSGAREALEYVGRFSRDRSMFSKSRVHSIVAAARHCALTAVPDPQHQIEALDAQIAELQQQRDALQNPGDDYDDDDYLGDNDDVYESFTEVRQLLAQLPSDFMRVIEAMKEIQREIVDGFREEDRPSGEVVRDYLERSSELMTASPEGRAFAGAMELLRDDQLLGGLRDDVATILDHPFARQLTRSERSEFRDAARIIERGIASVNQQQHRLTRTLTAHLQRHDAALDREVDRALQRAKQALAQWYPYSNSRSRVQLTTSLPRLEIGHLQQRFPTELVRTPPAPLTELDHDQLAGVSLEQLRAMGCPQVPEVARHLIDLVRAEPRIDAVDAFAAAPDWMRRPADILAYVHLAAVVVDGSLADVPAGIYESIRPDGEVVRYRAPALTFTANHAQPLDVYLLESTDELSS